MQDIIIDFLIVFYVSTFILSLLSSRRLSLVVEFLLWVQEVASSILAVAPLCGHLV